MSAPAPAALTGLDSAPFDLEPQGPAAGRSAALCLHGLTGTPYEIRPVAEALAARGIRARGPVLPGHDSTPAELATVPYRAWMDTVLMGKINPSGWVAINALPTAAHTIWGVLAGKLLMSERPGSEKLRYLMIGGLIGLGVGYGLDLAGITPIIKRICTSSFVIVTGGWCLVTLALFYWLMDLKGSHRGTKLFVIVGLNPIFIYMFAETLGEQWFNDFVAVFTHGILGWLGAGEGTREVLTAFVVLGLMTYLCHWLYERRIFIKI